MQVGVLLLAAGRGNRMGGGVPKQYLSAGGKPLLLLALESLAREPRISVVQPVIAEDDRHYAAMVENARFPYRLLPAVSGGKERADSMRHGLAALPEDVDWVAVHDAARPIPSAALLAAVLDTAAAHGAAVPGLAVHDTIKQVDDQGRVMRTLARSALRAVQTPQVARRAWFEQALGSAQGAAEWTDDASLLEAAGFPVYVSAGEENNRKITTAEDLAWLRRLMEARD
ncbi:MAG TPA: 2-C-methyl-D-erythritol 4-phosphate cytidylyltransferase [Mariprofundaceae bacterium]|nr:2-C-methyl-D-erythritol 4-phosphate cytidylyltransferase [Mariprofundaceae bacterium]